VRAAFDESLGFQERQANNRYETKYGSNDNIVFLILKKTKTIKQ
jgi:hypothetical protein